MLDVLLPICVNVLHCRCVVLIPEESEDMWHAYNLISVRDVLKSTTIRFVFITVYVKRNANADGKSRHSKR